jgi:hypothetical protein
MIASLSIPGLIVSDSKEPAADIVLRAAGGQVVLQTDKRILHDILRFVARESETDQVSQQRFAQFAIQSGNLRGACRKAQEWQRQGYGIVTHEISIAPLFIEQGSLPIFRPGQ